MQVSNLATYICMFDFIIIINLKPTIFSLFSRTSTLVNTKYK